MNYRHAFHAGNFADVVKHAVLARLIVHLKAKDAAFRVLDTHAGTGRYDLGADEATRTGEWRGGIARVLATTFEPAVADLLAPYLETVAALGNDAPGDATADDASATPVPAAGSDLRHYPGSPLVVRHLLRRQDRLTATELHPADAASLAALFAGDQQVRVVELDGWLACKSFLPFKERRGLTLIDPPFEARDEFDRLVDGLVAGYRRFATGLFALWYPIKDEDEVAHFRRALAATGIRRILAAELRVAAVRPNRPLAGCGLILVNPPWRLDDELAILLPALAGALATGPGSGARMDWLAGE